jgi:hypothetical protein
VRESMFSNNIFNLRDVELHIISRGHPLEKLAIRVQIGNNE